MNEGTPMPSGLKSPLTEEAASGTLRLGPGDSTVSQLTSRRRVSRAGSHIARAPAFISLSARFSGARSLLTIELRNKSRHNVCF